MPVEGPVVRLWLPFTLVGSEFGWGHHFRVNVPYTDFPTFAADLVANWNAACNELVFGTISTQIFGQYPEVTVVDPPSDDVYLGTYSPYNQGQWDHPAGPLQAALTIRWQTLSSGRSGRGRTRVSGFAATDLGGYSLTSSVHEFGELYVQYMLAAFGPVGTFNQATLGILSRQHDGEVVDPPLLQPVVSGTVNPNLTTMRRRAYHGFF